MENTKTLETELKEWKDKYIGLENKLNETIKMTNQLILNVNGANKFICELHNALADAGLIKKPAEIIKDIKDGNIPEGAKKLMEGFDIKDEPEPEMEEVN